MAPVSHGQRLVIGISGSSGPHYGIRLLEVLRPIGSVESHLVISRAARRTIELETDTTVTAVEKLADVVYRPEDLAAAISSGTFLTSGMVVAPCSMKTLAAIAHGYADDLLTRAADVTLKERRPLIVLPREAPLSVVHIKNMLAAAEAGATILPPAPAFYGRPQTIAELIDHTIGKVLDLLGIHHELSPRWPGAPARA
jgi:polyprenyl P-hydroxybenzoate/phenylacrylic acid decarboxylase-like protein